MINILNLDIEKYISRNNYEADGIIFTDIAIVKLFIDNSDIHHETGFKDALIYYPELLRSTNGSGKYLIFTCACGVADDAGWDYVDIKFFDNYVEWRLFLDNRIIQSTFEKTQYQKEIIELSNKIEKIENNITLEPEHVIFPDDF